MGRTWAPRGERPVLRRVTKDRHTLSTAIGLTLSGRIYKRHFNRAMRGEEVIQALDHVGWHMAKRWILVWDRATIHRRKKVQDYLAQQPEIVVEWLPPYAPEINAEDGFAVSRQRQETSKECDSSKSGRDAETG